MQVIPCVLFYLEMSADMSVLSSTPTMFLFLKTCDALAHRVMYLIFLFIFLFFGLKLSSVASKRTPLFDIINR